MAVVRVNYIEVPARKSKQLDDCDYPHPPVFEIHFTSVLLQVIEVSDKENLERVYNQQNPHDWSQGSVRPSILGLNVAVTVIRLESVVVEIAETSCDNPKKVHECEPCGFLSVVVQEVVHVQVLNLLLVAE